MGAVLAQFGKHGTRRYYTLSDTMADIDAHRTATLCRGGNMKTGPAWCLVLMTMADSVVLGQIPPPDARPDVPRVETVSPSRTESADSKVHTIATNEARILRISTGQPIRHLHCDDDRVARVLAADLGGGTAVAIAGLSYGTARFILRDCDGHSETHVVNVQRLVCCPLGVGQFEFRVSGTPIVRAVVADRCIATVDVLPVRRRGIRVTGLAPGRTDVTLTYVDGTTEPVAVHVEAVDRLVFLGARQDLRLSTGEPIRSVRNDGETTVVIEPTEADPTSVQMRAIGPGVAEVTLNGTDGRSERVRVGVRKY